MNETVLYDVEELGISHYDTKNIIYTDSNFEHTHIKDVLCTMCDQLKERADVAGGIVDWSTLRIETYSGHKAWIFPSFLDGYAITAKVKMKVKEIKIDDNDMMNTLQK